MEIRKVKTRNGNTLVKDNKNKEISSGGIIIPENSTEEMKTGTVISTSGKVIDKEITINSEVKEGDKVIYRNVAGAGNCWQEDGELYRILNQAEILAVVE